MTEPPHQRSAEHAIDDQISRRQMDMARLAQEPGNVTQDSLPAATSGGTLNLDPEELEATIRHLEAERDDMAITDSMVQNAVKLAQAPANDAASQLMAQDAQKSLRAMWEHHQSILHKMDAAIERLRKALQAHRETEQTNTDNANTTYRD